MGVGRRGCPQGCGTTHLLLPLRLPPSTALGSAAPPACPHGLRAPPAPRSRSYSPHITEMKVLSSRKVRRAKLYYLRQRTAKELRT